MFYCYNYYYYPHAWIPSSVLGPKLGLRPFKARRETLESKFSDLCTCFNNSNFCVDML